MHDQSMKVWTCIRECANGKQNLWIFGTTEEGIAAMKEINRDTFDESPAKTKMSLLFDSVCNIEDKVDTLTRKLDVKLKIDKIYVCLGGFLGAAFALLLREVPKWIS